MHSVVLTQIGMHWVKIWKTNSSYSKKNTLAAIALSRAITKLFLVRISNVLIHLKRNQASPSTRKNEILKNMQINADVQPKWNDSVFFGYNGHHLFEVTNQLLINYTGREKMESQQQIHIAWSTRYMCRKMSQICKKDKPTGFDPSKHLFKHHWVTNFMDR